MLCLFLSALLKLHNVERGSIWVKDEGEYVCLEASGRESEKIKGLRIGAFRKSIVGWVIENGQKAIADAGVDERHYFEIENDFEVKSKVILCFPLILEAGEVYGAIQLIETSSTKEQIHTDESHIALIENIINICSIAISKHMACSVESQKTKELKRTIEQLTEQNIIVGKSKNFLDLMHTVESYAQTDFPVLITGESGTGKELIARQIHRLSKRSGEKYLVQNCSTIPEHLLESELFGHKKGSFTGAIESRKGLFEDACGGTVFLDEIGDMPFGLQAKILRFIQSGEVKPVGSTTTIKVNVRLIAATNVDLKDAIQQKKFREDLYYRLNVLPVSVPPLRYRQDDIELLLDFFVKRQCKVLGISSKTFSAEALKTLLEYPWRGNIRELENFTKFIVVTSKGDVITISDLPEHMKTPQLFIDFSKPTIQPDTILNPQLNHPSTDNTLDNTRIFDKYAWRELEERYALYLLEKYRWNISKAAEHARLNRSTFDSKLKKFGLRRNHSNF